MPTTWKNKMIEQRFNHADSTIKKMTDLFETRVEYLEPKEENKNHQQLPRIQTSKVVLVCGILL